MTWAFRRRCPNCKERQFARAHRHGLAEHMVSILWLPYRCDECDFRFLGYRGWVRRRTAAGGGAWLHALGFAVSVAVIALSARSVMHSLNEPPAERKIAQAATDAQGGGSGAPAAAEEPAAEAAVSLGSAPAVHVPVAKAAAPAALATRTAGTAREISPRKDPTRPRASAPSGGVRLRSRSSVVIVASNQFAAHEVGRRSPRLGELIQGGSLFSISNGTAAAVEEQKDGIARVRILQGAMAGKHGWVPDAEISAK